MGVLCRFPYDRGLFSVIFLHFLPKYRCVPKIGFSADIFLHVPSFFFRSIVVYLNFGSRLTFFLTPCVRFCLFFLNPALPPPPPLLLALRALVCTLPRARAVSLGSPPASPCTRLSARNLGHLSLYVFLYTRPGLG